MAIAAEYVLSAYSFLKSSQLDDLLNVGYKSKEGNPIPSFDENVLIDLCSEARLIFEKESNILELEGDYIIVGDIHGSFHDLLRIFHYIEKVNLKVLFLGDYVDRGEFSLECITLLFALKSKYPDFFYLLRGNHEFDSICSQYGFKNEIINYHNPKKVRVSQNQAFDENYKLEIMNYDFDEEKSQENNEDHNNSDDEYYANHNDLNCYKYSEKLYEAFVQAFAYLPISAVINNTTLCIHGGLSPRFEILENLRIGVTRPINNFEDSKLLTDVVWSDPSISFSSQFDENPRGRGYLFNTSAVTNFLNTNSLTRIIRAHQCVKHGSLSQFNDKCITVFSASSYGPDMANNSGIVKLLESNNKVRFVTFPPIPRLHKCDAFYFKVQQFGSPSKNESEKIRICFSIRHPKLGANSALRPFPCQAKKQIKGQQSQHYLKPQSFTRPVFVTSSRKTTPIIHKPLSHSVSVDGLINETKRGSISAARSLQSINESNNESIPAIRSLINVDQNNNEKRRPLEATRSLLCIDQNSNEKRRPLEATRSLLCIDQNNEEAVEGFTSAKSMLCIDVE